MQLKHSATLRKAIVVAVTIFALFSATAGSVGAASAAPKESSANTLAAPDTRAVQLLSQMTLDEKVQLMQGIAPGYFGYKVPGIPRLGIPDQLMLNNGNGVHVSDPAVRNATATALPSSTSLGASFDPGLATSYGALIGAENAVSGANVLLGPAGDLIRQPFWGRSFESYGEDPFLSSGMSAAEIQGIQSVPGQIATAKHATVYNQESGRGTLNVNVSEKALQEVYYPSLKDSVQKGKVGTVMCSFSKINGTAACEDKKLLTDALRNAWDFEGWVMSDYGATHSTVASLNAGLNQEQVGPEFYNLDNVRAAIDSGDVTLSTIDSLVFEILRTMFAFGLFDHPATISQTLPAEHHTMAANVSAAGSVLLKNVNNALPLGPAPASIAVIGDAATWMPQGGGSGNVAPYATTNVVDALTARAVPGSTVTFAQGYDPLSAADNLPNSASAVGGSVFAPSAQSEGATGLTGQYWTNGTFQGDPVVTRTDQQPKFQNGFASWTLDSGFMFDSDASQIPIPSQLTQGPVSMQWFGTFTAPASGAYTFTTNNNGSAVLSIDDQPVVTSEGGATVASTTSASLNFAAGEQHAIKLTFQRADSGSFDPAQIGLSWSHPAAALTPKIAEAAALAAASNVAVVVVRDYETEGQDRASLALPSEQDLLVSSVAAVNPNTIVVVASNGPILMPWLSQVPAVLNNWYGGEAWGTAIAQLLYGDVNPSGKLPVTFPTSDFDTPVNTTRQYPGVGGTVTYSEGVNVGYRGYQAKNIPPLFPFGYGRSYTTFSQSNLKVTKTADNTYTATVRVTNTGTRTGTTLVQGYINDPAYLNEPANQLKAFAKVTLVPGQVQKVTLALTPDSFSRYNESISDWRVEPGVYQLRVGDSSANLTLKKNIVIG